MKNAHEAISSDVFPDGVWLHCANPECDRGERVSSADCARYLASGWPMHCGMTMGLGRRTQLTPREAPND